MRNHVTRAPSAETFSPGYVFNRDRWICGICQNKINKFLEYPHPESASLDHIIPIARDGRHTLSNVQAAHLRCNLAKGARLNQDQQAI
ncbi:HNH endonuclease [Nonomuraea sp. NPDC050451]|uniref:HNH endonuclease n=1 Tax=Nonomuraea sp. NPDC050451 TaxID=3364364 RepID=UPI0037AFEADE